MKKCIDLYLELFIEQFNDTFRFIQSISISIRCAYFLWGVTLLVGSLFFLYLGFNDKSQSFQIFFFTGGILLFFFALIFIVIAYLEKFPQLKSKNNLLQNEKNLNSNEKVKIDIEGITLEYDFKRLFSAEIYFIKFKEKAIENGYIDHDFKWLFKKDEILYFALLFFKLKENDYFKKTIGNKVFCEVSSSLMGINLDPSMLSKYNPLKENNPHIKAGHLKYYNEEYSIFC